MAFHICDFLSIASRIGTLGRSVVVCKEARPVRAAQEFDDHWDVASSDDFLRVNLYLSSRDDRPPGPMRGGSFECDSDARSDRRGPDLPTDPPWRPLTIYVGLPHGEAPTS